MLRISTPWDSQPQEAVGINPDNPIAAALDYLWVGNSLIGRDEVANAIAPPPSTCVLSPTSKGLAVSSASFSTGTTITPRKTFQFPYVQIGYGYFNNAASNHTLTSLTGSVGSYLSTVRLTSSTQVEARIQYNGTARSVSVTLPTSLNVPICAMIVAYSDTDWRFFCNGQQSNGTLSPGTGTSMNRVYPIGHQIIGGVWLTGFGFGRAIPDKMALEVTQSPELLWQLFAPRTIWVPVSSASSGTSFTITPSGGISFGGTSVDVKGKILTVSGGVTFSGTGSATFASGGTTYTITPTGGLVFAGSGVSVNSKVFLPSGGITFGGSGLDLRTKIIDIGGGVSLGGTGNMTSNTSTGPVQSGERTKVGVGT